MEARSEEVATAAHSAENIRQDLKHNTDIYAPPLSPLLSWHTRVLALHSGARGDPLVVDLYLAVITHKAGLGIVAEDRNEEYEALSYTWGSQEPTHPLTCNGQSTKVTENLFDALQRLRRRHTKRYIWADAVCINQQDNDERARQVRNLQVVFERARKVVVWLGRAIPSSNKAIDFATLLTSKAYTVEKTSTSPDKAWHEDDARQEARKILQGADQNTTIAVLQGLLDLAQRAWMSRSWVIQEVHAASRISVRCGSHSIPWKAYTQIHNILKTALWYAEFRQQRPPLKQHPSYFALPIRNKARAMHIWSVHRALQSESEGDSVEELENGSSEEDKAEHPSYRTLKSACTNQLELISHAMEYLRARGPTRGMHPKLSLTTRLNAKRPDPSARARGLNRILLESNHLRAQDDRDRIFALLGLTDVPTSYGGEDKDIGNNGIAIDYDKSTSRVFQNATRYFINQCQHLGPLYYKWAVEQKDDLRPLELPSWTPDWRQVDVERYLDSMIGPLDHPWDQLTGSDLDLHLSCMYDKPKFHYDRVMRSSLPHWPGTYFVHPQDNTPDILKLHGRTIGRIASITESEGRSFPIQLRHSGVMNMWIMKARGARSLPTYSSTITYTSNTTPEPSKRERQTPAEKKSSWLASSNPQINDILAFVFGGLVPFILREREQGGWTCVGYAVPNQKIGNENMLDLVSSSLLTASGMALDEFDVY